MSPASCGPSVAPKTTHRIVPPSIHDVGVGEGRVPELGRGPAGGVEQARVRHVELPDPGVRGIQVVVVVDPEEAHAVGGVPAREIHQLGLLGAARRAVRRPDVDDQDAALRVRRGVELGAVERLADEPRQRPIHLGDAEDRVLARRARGRGDDQQERREDRDPTSGMGHADHATSGSSRPRRPRSAPRARSRARLRREAVPAPPRPCPPSSGGCRSGSSTPLPRGPARRTVFVAGPENSFEREQGHAGGRVVLVDRQVVGEGVLVVEGELRRRVRRQVDLVGVERGVLRHDGDTTRALGRGDRSRSSWRDGSGSGRSTPPRRAVGSRMWSRPVR